MKSFIEHINEEEEILDKKPKVAVDEATMGDLLLGLGAAGGLLALKKGWDKFGKGSKLARTLAVTTKQKQKVAKDAKEKRDSEIDAADDVLADPNSSPRAIKNANKYTISSYWNKYYNGILCYGSYHQNRFHSHPCPRYHHDTHHSRPW